MDLGSHSLPNTVFTFKRHPARKLPWKSLPLEELLLCSQSLFVLCVFSDRAALHPALPAEAQAHPPADAAQHLLYFPMDGGRPPTTEDCRSLMRCCDGESFSWTCYTKSHFCLRVPPFCPFTPLKKQDVIQKYGKMGSTWLSLIRQYLPKITFFFEILHFCV